MLLITRRFASTLRSLKEPEQLADFVIEQMNHSVILNQPGASAAAQYDLTQQVLSRANRLIEKLGSKKLHSFLEGGKYFHFDKKSLDDFDALVLSRISRFHNPNISLLDINGNPDIADDGLLTFARPDIPMSSFFASSCEISDSGISGFAETLARNSRLEILELRKNKISDPGCFTLAQALNDNPYPRNFVLYLSGNSEISDEGALALAKVAMSRNVKVWLMECPKISEEFKTEINKYSKSLRFFCSCVLLIALF